MKNYFCFVSDKEDCNFDVERKGGITSTGEETNVDKNITNRGD